MRVVLACCGLAAVLFLAAFTLAELYYAEKLPKIIERGPSPAVPLSFDLTPIAAL
jgi:hypothetical protein